jgi:ribonuclease P protein component
VARFVRLTRPRQSGYTPRSRAASRRPSRENDEADLPTTQPTAQARPRLPRADVDEERPTRHRRPAQEGPQASDGLATVLRWYSSIRRSGEFARARQRGRRLNLGTLRGFGFSRRAGPVRIGITVPSAVGGAVVRNLLRRRIQGALDALPAGARPVGPTDLVLIVRPEAAAAPYATLAADVGAAVAGLSGRRLA